MSRSRHWGGAMYLTEDAPLGGGGDVPAGGLLALDVPGAKKWRVPSRFLKIMHHNWVPIGGRTTGERCTSRTHHWGKWRRTGLEVPVCRKSSKLNKNWCGVRYTIMEAGFQI